MTNRLPITNPLGEFVRAVRARLRPEDFGLPPGHRRRTTGLRREEAAQLCGISPTWFTWIEQGRTTGISHMSLMAIARGLRLSRSERSYLFTLAGHATPVTTESDLADPHRVQPLVDAIQAPAYVLDRHWDAVAWNKPAQALFMDWLGSDAPDAGRNLLRYVFVTAEARHFISDWPERSRRLVAEFRADTASLRGDPHLQAMIEDLSHESPDFSAAWKSQAVLGREGGSRQFIHPVQGLVTCAQFTLRLTTFPDLKLITLVPVMS